MCDPVSATGLALSMAGSYMQTKESNKNAKRVQNARDNAYQTGMIRQKQYADESGAAFGENVQNQSRESFDNEAAKEGDRLKQAFADVRTEHDYNNTGMLSSTPKNVVIAQQDANTKADAKTDRDLSGMADLRGYSGAMFNQDTSRNNFARMFGNLQDKASHDSALIPLDMQSAGNNASKSPSLFPTLLKAAGMAMGMYGSANGITSFGDKVAFGPLKAGQSWSSMTQPGLFTSLQQLPNKIVGGGLY